MKDLLIIGCGYLGRRIVPLALEMGLRVATFNRGEARVAGTAHYCGNLDQPDSLRSLPTRGAGVLYLAPPPGGGHEETRVRNFCQSIAPGEEPAKVVYVSTSAVYGDCPEGIVTEETPPNPTSARGKRRLSGERLFTEWGWERGVAVVILRVSAIYAPDKLPFGQLQAGLPVLKEEECLPTNRIHADDLSRICLAALSRGAPGDVFNVSDGAPGTMTQYFNAAADYLGLPRPPQVSREEARQVMTPLMISYFSEARVLDSTLLLRRLGITLRYPDLEAGLKREN